MPRNDDQHDEHGLTLDHELTFCVIKDETVNEALIARVKIAKKSPIQGSIIGRDKVEIADTYIWPSVERVKAWGASLTEDDERRLAPTSRSETHTATSYCSTCSGKGSTSDETLKIEYLRGVWDLGNPFGCSVSRFMTRMT